MTLAKQRWRLSLWLTAIVTTIYFSLLVLIAYNKPLLGNLLVLGLSLRISLGAMVIVALWILIFPYRANNYYNLKSQSHEDEW
ncbi:MAG: hypothetical protein CLLPBCKN_006760 [Chroococcidiopsis cubana SAG 39.79]|uniref:DUF485 domain-containing protein n=2 Tax=Chroococcidiopsis TaxID=54298 RepID=A0AB37U9P9_9CYAN|nr:DUF485 domain-containing protein [Chroococcidiopsis cubana]MDZ4877325.1 hypothetical protein [Chroococcidiopsis cubana SAG 39.79]RUT00679.1 hypothetical protein DSM107010_67310 [Chroococcidiopsis cubana SAG 39.79]